MKKEVFLMFKKRLCLAVLCAVVAAASVVMFFELTTDTSQQVYDGVLIWIQTDAVPKI